MERPRTGAGLTASVLAILLVPVAAGLEAQETDARGDVVATGEPGDLPHLDILNATASLDGAILALSLELAAAPPEVPPEDLLNYQILINRTDGTGDRYPPGSGWDLSVVCRVHGPTVRPGECYVQQTNATLESASWDGSTLHARLAMPLGEGFDHLVVGGGAAQQHPGGQQSFTALDFTDNAGFDTPVAGAGEADRAERPDDSISPWWFVAAVAAGIGLGWIWSYRRKHPRRRR